MLDVLGSVLVVVLYFTGDLSLAFSANYSEFPNSCLAGDFPGFVNVLQVLIDRWLFTSKSVAISFWLSQMVSFS